MSENPDPGTRIHTGRVHGNGHEVHWTQIEHGARFNRVGGDFFAEAGPHTLE